MDAAGIVRAPAGVNGSIASFELRPRELTFDAVSGQRLDGAIALVAGTIGSRARLLERRVEPLEAARSRSGQRRGPAANDDETMPTDIREAVIAGFARARFERMLDEADPRFDG